MSYTKTTWATGNVITIEKLNKIEQGIANGGGFIVIFPNGNNLGYSFNDIRSMLEAGNIPIVKAPFSDGYGNIGYSFQPLYIGQYGGRNYMVIFGYEYNNYKTTWIANDTDSLMTLDTTS